MIARTVELPLDPGFAMQADARIAKRQCNA
jgi:hypothetical protein